MNNEQLTNWPTKTHLCFGLRVFVLQLLIAAYSLLIARGQVPNDNIENRRVMQLEEVISSTTTGCTVQKSAVDESLTGKCIEYHNDQWFEFTPRTSGRYYVNISGQQCRDTRGVQLVVLTGTPGQPATYHILSCTSFGNQDDVFVTLEGLQAGQPYLLDVDGYLKDFCQFRMVVSSTPHGQPLTPPVANSTANQNGRTVVLGWNLPDSVTATHFEVRRREGRQFRSVVVGKVATQRNTSGQWVQKYSFTDTLPVSATWSRYEYQILAQTPTEPSALIGKQVVEWRPSGRVAGGVMSGNGQLLTGTPVAGYVALPLAEYPPKANLSVLVTDAATGQVLRSAQLIRARNPETQNRLLVSGFKEQGVSQIKVRITHHYGSGNLSQNIQTLVFSL